MANHSIDIYCNNLSPPSRSVLLLLKALGLKSNIKLMDLLNGDHLKPEFLKLNPLHTIPTINDKGFVLYDSHVIMKYLVDQYAKDDSLYPKDAKQGALVNQKIFFSACTLMPRLFAYLQPTLFHKLPPNPAQLSSLEEALVLLDGFLNGQIWVAGPNLTIADFSTIALISTIEACEILDLQKYEHIWAWYQRTKNAMAGFGYEEVNQSGATVLGGLYKSILK